MCASAAFTEAIFCVLRCVHCSGDSDGFRDDSEWLCDKLMLMLVWGEFVLIFNVKADDMSWSDRLFAYLPFKVARDLHVQNFQVAKQCDSCWDSKRHNKPDRWVLPSKALQSSLRSALIINEHRAAAAASKCSVQRAMRKKDEINFQALGSASFFITPRHKLSIKTVFLPLSHFSQVGSMLLSCCFFTHRVELERARRESSQNNKRWLSASHRTYRMRTRNSLMNCRLHFASDRD